MRLAKLNWSCSTSPDDSTFSSDSIDGCDRYSATRRASWPSSFPRDSGGFRPAASLRFDEQVREDVIAQMRRAIPSDQAGIRALLREPAHAGLSLAAFLRETDVALDDVYRKDRSWWGLRQSAGLDARTVGEEEKAALENVHKLIHVGDERRLGMWARLTSLESPVDEADRRLARMLFAVLYGKEIAAGARAEAFWAEHALLREEIAGLVPVLRELNAVLAPPHALAPEIPLVLHARYLGVELSAAFDHRTAEGRFRDYYTGVEPTDGGSLTCCSSRSIRPPRRKSTCVTGTSRSMKGGSTGSRKPGPRATRTRDGGISNQRSMA